MTLPTMTLNQPLDVRGRLAQLHVWYEEWQQEDTLLSQRLSLLDPKKKMDVQLGAQMTRWKRRLRLKLIQTPFEIATQIIQTVGYDRLRAGLAPQFAALSKPERQLWLHNFLFVMTPDLRQLNDKLDQVRSYHALGQQRNFLLGGPSGMGKSTYLDWFTLHHAATIQPERNHVPVVKIDAPVSNHTPKPLFQRMLLEFGTTYSRSQNEEDLLMLLALFFQQCGTELLIVDEIEHITRPILRRRLLEVSNLTHGLPIVCASCHPMTWIQGDTEVAGRWNDYFELRQYTGERLRQLLAFMELLLPFTQPSYLALDSLPNDHTVGPASLIERWTGGILRDIMILLVDATQRAIESNLPCLTPTVLQTTWEAIQTTPVTDFLALAHARPGGPE